MTLSQNLSSELKTLAAAPGTSPGTVTVSDPAGRAELTLDVAAADRLSVALSEIRLGIPALATADAEALRDWAAEFSRRVTYLLEPIGPLEVDTQTGQVLVRSNPPQQQGSGTSYYEILLQSQAGGNFTLRRFRAEKNPPSRQQVDMNLTHEVLCRLADDLVDSLPPSA